MAISTRLGRCYRCPARGFARCAPCCVREQGVQGRQRGQRRDRLHRRLRRAARDGVEHPDRDLLRARRGRVHERAARAARCRAGRSLNHVMGADQAPGPGMPSVDNGDLVAGGRIMGLLVRDWITPFDRTRRSAPSRPRQRSYCGRRSFPNQLRRPPRPWRSGLSCTNTRPAPLHGGRPCSWPDPTCTRLSEQSASPSWIIPRSRSGKGTDETSASTWRGDSAEAEPPNFVSVGRSKGDS